MNQESNNMRELWGVVERTEGKGLWTRIGTAFQNRDGSWAGHHCITGRTAVTGLAVLTLTAERQVPRVAKKRR